MALLDFIGGAPGNYVLGRGKLYIQGEFTNSPLGWRDVGNATAFTLTQESEKKEHLSYLSGIKTVDLEVAVSTKVTVAFTVDEVQNLLNQAAFLSGSVIGYTGGMMTNPFGFGSGSLPNAAAVASNDTTSWGGAGPFTAGVSNNFYKAANTVYPELWYDIEMVFNASVGTWRAYNFDSTQTITVTHTPTMPARTGGTPLTEGTHYELDREMGRIRMKSGWNPAQALLVAWTAPTVARNTIGGDVAGLDTELKGVKLLTSSGITVAVKFVLDNPNNDVPVEYELFKVKLTPDGDLALIGDDWGAMSFTGVLSTITNPPLGASAYGRITARNVMVS